MHPLKKTARIAGAIYLSMVFTAPFTLLYVPGKLIVRGDATATANNILAHETMFRFAIIGDLFTHVIFICLGIALYRLLSSVSKTWALLMVVLVLVSAAVGFLDTLNNVAALILFRGADFLSVFDKPQLNALGYLFIRLHGQGIFMNEIFWGSVAFSLRTAGISLRVSAAIHRRLAHDQLFRLCGAVPYRVILPGLLRSRVQMGAAGPVWRTGDHALAFD